MVTAVKILRKHAHYRMKVMNCYSKCYPILLSVLGNAYLLLSNILYIHRVSMDGSRIKTLYSTNTLENIIAVDYNYRYNYKSDVSYKSTTWVYA